MSFSAEIGLLSEESLRAIKAPNEATVTQCVSYILFKFNLNKTGLQLGSRHQAMVA